MSDDAYESGGNHAVLRGTSPDGARSGTSSDAVLVREFLLFSSGAGTRERDLTAVQSTRPAGAVKRRHRVPDRLSAAPVRGSKGPRLLRHGRGETVRAAAT